MSLLLDNNSQLDYVIEYISSKQLPFLRKLLVDLKELRDKAKESRKNCLIAKTVGVSTSAAGSLALITGICLSPITLGASVIVVGLPGMVIGSLGAVTAWGTSIVDEIIESKDKKRVAAILEEYKTATDHFQIEYFQSFWNGLTEEDKDLLPSCDENYVSAFLAARELYSDEEVSVNELKEGDHISRPIKETLGILRHHGVVLKGSDGFQVIELNNGNNIIKDLKRTVDGVNVNKKHLSEFLGGKTKVFRRNYKGFSLPLEETVKLAEESLRQRDIVMYNLFSHNCEHFATYLKIRKKWSKQVAQADTVVKVVNHTNIVKKTLWITLNAVDTVINIAKPVNIFKPTVASEFLNFVKTPFLTTPTVAIGVISKATLVLVPLATAIDIGVLVYDWKKDKVNVTLIQKYIEVLLIELNIIQQRLQELKNLRDIRILRAMQEVDVQNNKQLWNKRSSFKYFENVIQSVEEYLHFACHSLLNY